MLKIEDIIQSLTDRLSRSYLISEEIPGVRGAGHGMHELHRPLRLKYCEIHVKYMKNSRELHEKWKFS